MLQRLLSLQGGLFWGCALVTGLFFLQEMLRKVNTRLNTEERLSCAPKLSKDIPS